jgi:hypothetical protein
MTRMTAPPAQLKPNVTKLSIFEAAAIRGETEIVFGQWRTSITVSEIKATDGRVFKLIRPKN